MSLSRWCGLILLGAGLVGASLGAQAPAVAHAPALDRANLDTTCAPCTDFFRYANGGWLARMTIPAAYSSYGTLRELADRNEVILHQLLERDAAAATAGTLAQGTPGWKVGTFYASCMDTVTRDRLGLAPLKGELDTIAAIGTRADLLRTIAILERRDWLAPWTSGATQDSKDATSVIAYLGQGGLPLPDRDYYLKTDSASRRIRTAYTQHVVAIFTLAGDTPARAAAEARTVLAMETTMAKASKTRVELRDPVANYHRMTIAALDAQQPHLRWATFFTTVGAPGVTMVDLQQPAFLGTMDSLVAHAPIDDWKVLLRWHALGVAANRLSSPFVDENFRFAQVFTGARSNRELRKRCISFTDGSLGDLLGQEYVKEAFPPEAKARAVKIVSTLVAELHERISHLEWMSPETKAQAQIKLTAFERKIGYPDTWRDYATVTIVPGQFLANSRSAREWAARREWAKVGKPVDRTEWTMTPSTVNASYHEHLNEIVFPAGILQPPMYNPEADDAVNYGAMGAAIGHEMTHGFDDEGRLNDEKGNLRDWWTAEDAAKFKTEAEKISRQFSSYTIADGTHVNGELTLGENIADFGGVTVAYSAMERALGPGPHATIDGFTPEQRFFLAWAQVWRELDRHEYARMRVTVDEHSPPEWRVNGPLSNMPEFRAAWGCKAGDGMVRPSSEQPRIW
jgi:putative endopeptidase